MGLYRLVYRFAGLVLSRKGALHGQQGGSQSLPSSITSWPGLDRRGGPEQVDSITPPVRSRDVVGWLVVDERVRTLITSLIVVGCRST